MAFGKLYTTEGNPRTTAIRAAAAANNVDLEIAFTTLGKDAPEDLLKANPLGKIPTFVGADGYVLTECIAIAIYIASQNEKTTLLGKTKQDYASILKWMSFANTEFVSKVYAWLSPLVGHVQYNKKAVDEAQKATLQVVSVFESHLLNNTFLSGERITLADLFAAGLVSIGFNLFFDKTWRSEYPNVTRWYQTVCSQPIYSDVAGAPVFIDEAKLKNVAPKKEKAEPKKQAPKAAPKPQADEEEVPAPPPKPKHPLESLPKPTVPIDEWKRTYSNKDTPEALEWFWNSFYNPEEYSLWAVDYKYNEELTQTFMTSNLITGFFTRLEASRKYIMGCGSVYGVPNDSIIKGAFVIRGQDAMAAFDVAVDAEYYTFTKLDASKPEDKEFVNDQWTWEKPIVVNGKSYDWVDGKIFK